MSSPTALRFNLADALRNWARQDGLAWIFVFKTIAASFLALWVAFRLGFDQPKTAMTTVFIVAQPQSGLMLAKSFYRIVGTLAGLAVTLVLLALFAQYQELFLLAMTIWIGLCVMGAAWFRDFQAYAFVLAGYTACIIGFPGVLHPEAIFQIAQSRVSEILLGILCTAVISDAFFPQRLSPQLLLLVRGQYRQFVEFLQHAVAAPLERTVTPADQLKFVNNVLVLESMRASTLFEDPDSRVRTDRLRLFNTDFMAVSTTLHALQQLARRLRRQGRTQSLAALRPLVDALGPQLLHEGRAPAMAAEAVDVAAQLSAYRHQLRHDVHAAHQHLAILVTPEELLDFDCTAELLEQLLSELHLFTASYAALATARGKAERPAPDFVLHSHWAEAAVTGLRAVGAMLVVTGFWIFTAWPNGAGAATIACVGCALFASSPTPIRSVKNMALGFGVGMVAAYFCAFHILVHMDGFLLLCMGMLPFLMVGGWMLTKPQLAGIGAGFNLMITGAVGPENIMHFDVPSFINDGLSQLLGIGVAGIAFSLLTHHDPRAVQRAFAGKMRQELVRACQEPLQRLPHAFDGRIRDLMRQLGNLPEADRNLLLMCALSVLELGDAIIDFRRTAAMPLPAVLKPAVRQTLRSLMRGFNKISAENRATALASNTSLTQDLQAALRYQALRGSERDTVERLQRCLRRIHAVVEDDDWYLAFRGLATSSGPEEKHAA